MDFRQVESKWQRKWEKEKVCEADPSAAKKKFFLTAAFPYPNSPQHIGHARTYTTTDVYARYMRMKGHNVLFPMGFHVTGTPILAMAKRVAAKDPDLIDIFTRIYHIPEKKLKDLDEPVALVTYFSQEIEAGMKEMGFAIDWRRKFYSNDAHFNKFIQWQFHKLKEKGYLTTGSHPVPWCPNEDQAVGAHDTRGDVDPELDQVTLIKFEMEGERGTYFLCSTYRPETIYGVTNIWVNPKEKYVVAEIDGKKYVISQKVSTTLKFQIPLKVVKEIDGSELVGKKAKNLVNDEIVPVFPASFVNPSVGSGVVMSVPAHAPYDYLALMDLKGTKWAKEIPKLKQVLKLEGFGEFPAEEICKRMKISSQADPKAEGATAEIYKKEAHTGRMVDGKYAGKKGTEAKELVKEELVKQNFAFPMYDIVNAPVVCRCGGPICVKLVEDQWFINYGDPAWKKATHEAFSQMNLVPEKTRVDYDYTVDWLKEKACVRAQGLGTPFPFDEKKVIESLSDSTIYMAFYTIAHKVKAIDAAKLNDKFFDYVFLGIGSASTLALEFGVPPAQLEEMRKEFLYWYPHDSRHSGADLVHNHLPFFVFNHVAIFPRELWPKQIVTNGFVLMEGKKMSKSLGNILPLREAIEKYGADVVRFSVVGGAELSADTDFSPSVAEGVSSRVKWFATLAEENSKKMRYEKKTPELTLVDKWMLSRLHRRIRAANGHMLKFALREVAQEMFYGLVNDVRWYLQRGGISTRVTNEVISNWTLCVAPFMPHVASELWESLGNKTLAINEAYPQGDERKIDDKVEFSEGLILKTKEDIEAIAKILQKKPHRIHLFVASEWKRKLYALAREHKKFDVAMKAAMADEEIKGHAAEVAKMLQSFIKSVNELSATVLSSDEERKAFEGATQFLGKEFECEVLVENELDALGGEQKKKALQAAPLKPSIYFEI